MGVSMPLARQVRWRVAKSAAMVGVSAEVRIACQSATGAVMSWATLAGSWKGSRWMSESMTTGTVAGVGLLCAEARQVARVKAAVRRRAARATFGKGFLLGRRVLAAAIKSNRVGLRGCWGRADAFCGRRQQRLAGLALVFPTHRAKSCAMNGPPGRVG